MKFLHPANLTVNGGGPIIGQPVVNGNINEILFVDAGGNLSQSPYLTWTDATPLLTVGSSAYPQGLLTINGTTSQVILGDGVGHVNGTALLVDDSQKSLLFVVAPYGNGLITADGTGLVRLGDHATDVNGTNIQIDDTAKTISFLTAGPSIIMNGVSGPITYTAKSHTFATATYTGGMAAFYETGGAIIGDVGGTVNNTYIAVSDSTSTISANANALYYFGGGIYTTGLFGLDTVQGGAFIGDYPASGNSTYVQVDDTAKTAAYNADEGHNMGSTYGTFSISSAGIILDSFVDIFYSTSGQHIFTGGDISVTGGGAVIGAASIASSASLEVVSTTQGFLPPRMTTTQRTNIASPAEGLMVYDLTLHHPFYFNGTIWVSI